MPLQIDFYPLETFEDVQDAQQVIYSPPLREGLLFKTIDMQPRIVVLSLDIVRTEVFFLYQRKR